MSNNLVINFYKEQIKKVFKHVKDNDKQIEYLKNYIIILEEFIKKKIEEKKIEEDEFKLLNMDINTYNNYNYNDLENDPFILSIINFLE